MSLSKQRQSSILLSRAQKRQGDIDDAQVAPFHLMLMSEELAGDSLVAVFFIICNETRKKIINH